MAKSTSWHPTIRRQTPSLPPPLPPRRRWWTWPRQALVAAMAALSAFAAAAAFLPRVSVSPLSEQVASGASPTLFSINNVELVPLKDVQPMLGICQVKYYQTPETEDMNGSCTHDQAIGSFLLFTQWHEDEIGVDHSYTISLQDLLHVKGAPISYADISIEVEYQPAFLPWHQRASFRFTTRVQGDGKLYWIER